MEVRIYYPNGKTTVEFCNASRPYDNSGLYGIKLPFFIDAPCLGICYAEIICLDYPIAGFAFSTDSHPLTEAFEGDELSPLDEYSLEAATDRFQATTTILKDALPEPYRNPHIDRENDEGQETTGDASIDEFERLLRRFLADDRDPDKPEE